MGSSGLGWEALVPQAELSRAKGRAEKTRGKSPQRLTGTDLARVP